MGSSVYFEYNRMKQYCKDIDWKVNGSGISLKYCDARFQAAQVYIEYGYIDLALKQTMKAKNELAILVRESTRKLTKNHAGMDIFEFDAYCQKNDVETPELKLFWSIILTEAPHKFDSYMLFLEKNRLEKDKFYYPRRDCLRKTGVVDALQFLEDDKLDILSISLPPGTGKAQPLYSKILTPNGFVYMGDIKVGDKVIAANGNTSNVIGVFPQGKRKIYELTFDDGSKCRASDNHLWTVQTREDRRIRENHPQETYRTITTEDIIENLYINNGTRSNYSIDYVKPIDFAERELKLHPYVMGILIGDGYFGATPTFSIGDAATIENVNRFLPEGYRVKRKERCTYAIHGHEGNNCKAGSLVTKAIKEYGLFGHTAKDKFIPKEYLYASKEQRIWLLKGLMDSDGTADASNASYCTISEQLADDVIELVHSLGGYASKNLKNSGYRDKNGEYVKCNNSFNVLIGFDAAHKNIFATEKKQNKYNPKRNKIRRIIKAVDYVGEEECQCIYIDEPCHLYITDNYIITHNTTLEKFFCTWIIGRHPDDYSLFFSHSSDITRMFYDGVLDILTNDTEYLFQVIFPGITVESSNAKIGSINVGQYKPFASLQTTSVGAKNAGKVRANKYLLCDDLVSGIAEALSIERLNSLWTTYGVDAKQRKTVDADNKPAKELHIATRWSVHDIIGRLKNIYKDDPRAMFIAVPDIDPKTGKSNFEYKIGGMSVKFFNDQAKTMDDISYRCLYKNEPIEREGILYHYDELRTYLSLPERKPDAILAVCDTKSHGTDFMVMPIVYQYVLTTDENGRPLQSDYYLVDCVCDDNSDYGVQYAKLANKLYENGVQQCEFESNAGGDRISYEVNKRLTELGGSCNITDKPTETNKETRIIVNADWVKKNIIFKDKTMYVPKDDYGKLMSWLCRYSLVGKNEHDDVPDALANLKLFIDRGHKRPTVSAVFNPFRSDNCIPTFR